MNLFDLVPIVRFSPFLKHNTVNFCYEFIFQSRCHRKRHNPVSELLQAALHQARTEDTKRWNHRNGKQGYTSSKIPPQNSQPGPRKHRAGPVMQGWSREKGTPSQMISDWSVTVHVEYGIRAGWHSTRFPCRPKVTSLNRLHLKGKNNGRRNLQGLHWWSCLMLLLLLQPFLLKGRRTTITQV